jgi:hypothetical protein
MSDDRVLNAERGQMRSRSVLPRREGWTRELNISGVHVVMALMIILCLLRLLVWGFLKYWLFAPLSAAKRIVPGFSKFEADL